EEDVRILQEVKAEAESINRSCEEFGVEIYEVNPDGHCLFSAIADQLSLLEILPKSSMPQFAITRRAAASYMRAHDDDFIPFIPSIEGEDALDAATDTGLLTPEKFVEYCNAVASTALWGGEPEILALARKYEIKIVVVQAGPPAVVVHSPHPGVDEDPYGRAVRISYHRRMYGLGEHYNSLRPKTSTIDRLESLL
ncbi:uncharacterized protein EI90DRAFT_2901010, partial [Cantharellus anzutake]|uniref:uncharacterized protein n=1 Tax=Cantharellus anzutake TaxID=1750568 RepID=UPI001903F055